MLATGLVRALELRHDWSNVSSALEWAITRKNDPDTGVSGHELAGRLAFGCQGLWESQIPAIEGLRWVEQIASGLAPGECLDWMHYIRAVLAMQLDDFVVVHQQLDDLVESADTGPQAAAQAAGLLAFLSCRQYLDRARELVAKSVQICDTHELGPEH